MENIFKIKNEVSSPSPNSFSWRVPAIDGVRALAMLMVYVYHVWQFGGSPTQYISAFGYSVDIFGIFGGFPSGVDLFMVLSGFCLFLPLCKSPETLTNWNLKNYFVRRARRIIPPYYGAIVYTIFLPQILVFLYRLFGQEANWQPIPSIWQLATHLLFIHTLFIETWDGINGSFWSLGLEAQFYLTFPFVVYGFIRYKTRFLWAMIGLSIIYRIAIAVFLPDQNNWVDEFLFSIFFLGRWMQFASGMLAAWTVAQHWKRGQWRSPALGSAIILLSLLMYAIAVSEFATQLSTFPLRDLLLGITYAIAIVALCITKTPFRWLFENRAMVGLGFISYSFFLIHQPTAWFFSEFMRKKLGFEGTNLFFILCTIGFLIVIAISYLFFMIFERPFLNLANRPGNIVKKNDTIPVNIIIQDQAVP